MMLKTSLFGSVKLRSILLTTDFWIDDSLWFEKTVWLQELKSDIRIHCEVIKDIPAIVQMYFKCT